MDNVLDIILKNGMPKFIFTLFLSYFYLNITLIYAELLNPLENNNNNKHMRKTYWILALKSSYVPAIIGTIIFTFVLYILIMHFGYRYYSALLLYICIVEALSSLAIYAYNYLKINKR